MSPWTLSLTHSLSHTHTHTLTDRMWSAGLGMAIALGAVMGAIKYRHGTYIPPLPRPRNPPGPEPLPPREANGE